MEAEGIPQAAVDTFRHYYEQLAEGEWVRLTLPYTYPKFVMHREGDNYVPINPVGSVAEVDGATRMTYFYDAEKQLLHVKLMAKPGHASGAVWLETRD